MTNPASGSATEKTLRIGVLAGVGTLDPREMGDTITGLILGQIFEMPYHVAPSGAIEPHLFAEPLREERSGAQPIYSAAVREGLFFSDGTPLTAQIAAASLAKAGALRGRATVSVRDGRVQFAMTGPSPRFENVLTQWNCGIVLRRLRAGRREDHRVHRGTARDIRGGCDHRGRARGAHRRTGSYARGEPAGDASGFCGCAGGSS
jgi:hypothetical protein